MQKDFFQDFCERFGEVMANSEHTNAAMEGLTKHFEGMTISDRKDANSVYDNVIKFLDGADFIDAREINSRLDAGIERLGSGMSVKDAEAQDILELVTDSGVHPMYARQAAEEIGLILENASGDGYAFSDHFMPATESIVDSYGVDMSQMYGGDSSLYDNLDAAAESFGKEVNSTLSDVKLATTVALLRYHHSAIQRCLPIVPAPNNMVTYVVGYSEVYDLEKSRDNDGNIRQGNHRVPFVSLYDDPSPANTEPKPIVPLAGKPGVLEEGVLVIGKEVNLFDVARGPAAIGSSTDFTDLVGDGARIKNLFVELTDGTDTEVFKFDVSALAGSRFIMSANNTDSGDRAAMLRAPLAVSNDTAVSAGSGTSLFSGLTDGVSVVMQAQVSAELNLKSSITVTMGQLLGNLVLAEAPGATKVSADDTLLASITGAKIIGVELDAAYSEENLRKTTKALRLMKKQQSHVIKGATNAVVLFSINDSAPAEVVDGLSRLLANGNDHRGIQAVMSNLESVAAALANEKAIGGGTLGRTVADNYVAGQRVRPFVYTGQLTVKDKLGTIIANEKASELQSDIRAYVEKFMLELVTRLQNESFLPQELGLTNTPEYTVLTSGYILSSLFAVPHMHNHMDKSSVPASGPIEYRRILSNGAILNFVTTTFNYMTNKIILFPVLKNDARSILNYAQMRTRGTYVSKATTTVDNSVRNMIVGNQREMPIVTNPVGAIITVGDISDIFPTILQ